MSEAKPTVVLVHGAFADASSWNGVIPRLLAKGLPVTAPPNPLRGIEADSAYIAAVLQQIEGPILAVGHSYGGAVITNAATDVKNVVGLVYVAAFAPDQGEVLGAAAADSKDSVLEQCTRAPAVPHRGRRIGDGVLDRPGEGPRSVRGRSLRRGHRTHRNHPAAHLRARVLASPRARRRGGTARRGPSSRPATRRSAPTCPARWRSGPAPRSRKSRAPT